MDAYILGGLRSYVGVVNGMYRHVPAEKLGAAVLQRVMERYQVQRPDYIIAGNGVGAGGNITRLMALDAYEGSWYLTYFTGEELPELCADEKQYQRLWREYFETIAIRERTNSKCQRTMMPARYWKHLVEMK